MCLAFSLKFKQLRGKKMKKITTILLLAFFLLVSVKAVAIEGVELKRVEGLLTLLATKTDITFVRNGSKYSAERAVSHLRSKLQRAGDQISTAEQFVDNIASKSSLSGKPYLVILADGTTVKAAEYFHGLLREVDIK
jgi:hypothetical protein